MKGLRDTMGLFLPIILCFIFSCYGVGGTRISGVEGKKMVETNTVQTDIDSVICVDMYKQPAFDHPALKNHKIQTNPILPLDLTTNKVSSTAKLSALDLPSKGCPKGMVPIQRSKGENASFHMLTAQFPGQNFATLDLKQDGTVYLGAAAHINLQNPPVKMDQYSKAQIWLENGPPAEVNSIQVGWAVHPRLYGDNRTRITAYWTADAYKSTGCYNTECPGFVQVHPQFHLGAPFTNISVFKGDQFVADLTVVQDISTGNWWLLHATEVQIGYWPTEIFNHLRVSASLIRYGGNTFVSPDGISPPMGNGFYPDSFFKESCYFSQLKVINENNQTLDIDDSKVIINQSNEVCFRLLYWKTQETMGKTFTFGGPGGKCGT